MLQRLLLTRYIEMYAIKESLYDDPQAYMLFLDYNRESCFEDFPFLEESNRMDFQPKENYIKVVILHDGPIRETNKEEYYEIASGFLEDRDSCDWSMEFLDFSFDQVTEAYDDGICFDRLLNPTLVKLGFENTIGIINKKSHNNLMQTEL